MNRAKIYIHCSCCTSWDTVARWTWLGASGWEWHLAYQRFSWRFKEIFTCLFGCKSLNRPTARRLVHRADLGDYINAGYGYCHENESRWKPSTWTSNSIQGIKLSHDKSQAICVKVYERMRAWGCLWTLLEQIILSLGRISLPATSAFRAWVTLFSPLTFCYWTLTHTCIKDCFVRDLLLMRPKGGQIR